MYLQSMRGFYINLSRQVRGAAGPTGKLENGHTGVGAIDDIDITAIVDVYIVRLNRDFAALVRSGADASFICFAGDRRNVITDFDGLKRIAYVDGADTCIEMGKEKNATVVDRSHILV